MGVTGLWTVVKPCARPIKLETLNKKRLAVDASIWIYQFLKAVRDKEGNALRNAHVVGFFRRICKLLYFGIKPVFVFDGGAPALKRQTIASRKKRREGRREDAAKTATKLLAVQLQRKAEEEGLKRKQQHSREDEEEIPLPENLVYVEEALMTPKERQKNRQFRKKDAYHLPELDVSLEEMGAPNDPRIMSHEELEEYARQFHSGENINLYDFSNIDFDSPFFLSLPASDRYNILNAARLRSRLRMGYSKEQLDTMFPDRMAFSRFQIERVKERNDLTQRLMHINGMNGDDPIYGSSSRIAGEKNKEYILVKDPGVEGGWALGVLGNREGEHQNKPIDLDEDDKQFIPEVQDDSDEDVEFEDVPPPELNSVPDLPIFERGIFDESLRQNELEIARKRQQLYDSRRQAAAGFAPQSPANTGVDDNDDLFVPNLPRASAAAVDQLFEDDDDAENLRRAIQMSLEVPKDEDVSEDDTVMDALPKGKLVESQPEVPAPETANLPDADGDDMDLFAAIAKSKSTKHSSTVQPLDRPFGGPLPFKPFKVTRITKTGSSRLDPVDETAGGFERLPETKKTAKPQSLPPWFAGNTTKQEFIRQEMDDQYSGENRYRQAAEYPRILGNREIVETIDLDKDEMEASPKPRPIGPELAPECEAISNNKVKKPPFSVIPDKQMDVEGIAPAIVQTELTSHASTPNDTGIAQATEEKSPTPEFEDVNVPAVTKPPDVPANADLGQNSIIPLEVSEDIPEMDFENEYSDPEDVELMHQLAAETEEHARFASTLNFKSQAENAHDYERELKQLRAQQKKDRRDADEVSQIMVAECQQLLKLFGLPYVTAPMEAEAQCAELVSLGLVDGIVTDDSDIFLFGGTRIYKNMFNQAKFVECYLASDLEKEYSLDRKKLISFAHLLGSDYTEGIPGIGPVTALEILTEFPGLEEFRDWWSKVQMGVTISDDTHSKFRKKFKKNAAKLFLPPAFPDKRVDIAYLEPEVDPDPSAFQWGVPDLEALRQFLMSTVGWSPERTDEVLVPVIRDVNRRELEGTQANITQFFDGPQGAGAFAPRRRAGGQSRMEKAFTRLRHEAAAKQQIGNPGEEPATPAEAQSGEAEARSMAQAAKKRQRKGRTPVALEDEPNKVQRKGQKRRKITE
ncbi:DNA-repair protein rad13 [Coccidioides immitis RMSCC 2394]|uniref:DNA-repair protein rad13 n=1 Tax=Coccidioides immitis RMSCC 2394 TaxID=404692 RepID=A0A0J7B8V3_COCIT|nr:DNA-repair protein rad13 [Coccidioides immitis RMSCC 2394]